MQTTLDLPTEHDATADLLEAWDRFIGDPQAPWCSEHPRYRELVQAVGRLRTVVAVRQHKENAGE